MFSILLMMPQSGYTSEMEICRRINALGNIILEKHNYYRVSDAVCLRKESFGGIAFHKQHGTLLELDKDAFELLEFIRTNESINDIELLNYNQCLGKNFRLINRCLKAFIESGVMIMEEKSVNTQFLKLNCIFPQNFQQKNHFQREWKRIQIDKIQNRNLSAPETLHWAITYKCPNHCPDCYILRYSHNFPSELTTDEAFRVIDIISEWKILQVAIGGGEPLIRPDILQLLEYMHNKGLVIHLTTGMLTISFELMQSLSRFLNSIQIGIKHDLLLKNGENEKKDLSNILSLAARCKLEIGANLIICQSTINSFETIIKELYEIGFYRITLLRYKYPENHSRWVQENPSRESLLSLKKRVNNIIHTLSHLDIRMDCALSFLQVGLPSPVAQQYGLRGCVAADRILALTPDGKLFPCSQLIDVDLKCGHILDDDVHEIWNTNPIIQKYRNFRQQQRFRKSSCSKCGKERQCGGCRIFSEDHLGADTGCPLSTEINTDFCVLNYTQ